MNVEQVRGMRHPLLLQRSLPPLPPLLLAAAQDLDTSFLDMAGPLGSSVPAQAPPVAREAQVLLSYHFCLLPGRI